MLGSVARRSIDAAALGRANLRVYAAGNHESQIMAEMVKGRRIKCSCSMPMDEGGEIIEDLLSGGASQFAGK